MAKNANLTQAKRAKNDEFYTQYSDIEKEISAYVAYNPDIFIDKTILCPCDDYKWSNFTKCFADNFQKFGLKKLISTCYDNSGILLGARGKIQIVTKDGCKNGLLEGDGDFRSAEVTKLRDEADIIITNPPFSLFREFMAWIIDSRKQFSIIGNMNAITYKEIFPLIKSNQLWLGPSISSGDREFGVPPEYPLEAAGWRVDEQGNHYIRVKGVRWFTNIEHGRRHQPLELMTMADNIKYSKHKEVKGQEYKHYDNYDAIEVPFTDAIPSDYDGVMGVPISFLDKYCPEQFEIIGLDRYTVPKKFLVGGRVAINGTPTYARVLIRAK